MTNQNNEEERVEASAENASVVASSPSDVLEHLARMTDSLEKAWSEGLNTEDAVEARREAKEVWTAFSVALENRLAWVQQLDDGLGLGMLSEGFPLDDEALSRLELDPPGPAERYRQLQIASFYALHDLGDALKGLDEPTGATFDLLKGRVTETWWEAGAFVLIQRRAAALARILRAQEECLQELSARGEDVPEVPSESTAARPVWVNALTAAGALINQGWHEAALPQLLRALRLVLADAAGVDTQGLPTPLAPSLRRIPQLSPMARHVELLESSAERIGRGSAVDLGVAVPLAKELLVRFQLLARNPPPRQILGPLSADTDA